MERKESHNQVLVLDGGFSSQISRHVGSTVDGNPLWSAAFLKTNPEDVYQTHLDFLRAGADIISTNTYQASIGGFVKHLAISSDDAFNLIKSTVDLAKRARDTYLAENNDKIRSFLPLIAGSVGPYGAHLNDGSEYRGNYANKVTSEEIKQWHIPRIEALLEGGVDLLAIETIPCYKEAEVLVQLLKQYPKTKAWLSFSCKDTKSLANGDDFKTAVAKCWDANPDQLLAIGVNCCAPSLVSPLLQNINKSRDQPIPFIAYPNSGEKYNPEVGWIEKEDWESIHTFVGEWIHLGIKYIGGCCRTFDVDISRIRVEVDNSLHSSKHV